MVESGDHFDMSEYDVNHPVFGKCHDSKNKKILGKFKDETANTIITHVSAPRPKLYCLRRLAVDYIEDEKDKTKKYLKNEDGSLKIKVIETKKGKGISATALKNRVTMEDYTSALESGKQTYATMVGIRSHRHVLHTEIMKKKCINGLDSKRFGYNCINSLAFGHVDTPLYEKKYINTV